MDKISGPGVISSIFLFFQATEITAKKNCPTTGNTMKSQFSLMGYGINKKFLCKLDPEYNSNGSYDFCSTSSKKYSI